MEERTSSSKPLSSSSKNINSTRKRHKIRKKRTKNGVKWKRAPTRKRTITERHHTHIATSKTTTTKNCVFFWLCVWLHLKIIVLFLFIRECLLVCDCCHTWFLCVFVSHTCTCVYTSSLRLYMCIRITIVPSFVDVFSVNYSHSSPFAPPVQNY